MRRHELTDEQCKKIENMLPGREGHVGVTAKDNRIFISGVLWILKTGAPWEIYLKDMAIGKIFTVGFLVSIL